MMPSMKKKVSSFFKQLSVSGNAEDKNDPCRLSQGSFIDRYLSGLDTKKYEPTILYGRTPQELPPLAVGHITTSQKSVFASCTGPGGGLTSVCPSQKHLSTSDPDVDYIDIMDVIDHQQNQATANATNCVFSSVSGRWFNVPQSVSLTYPIDNSAVNIRAAGQLFPAGKKSVFTSVSDLSSFDDHATIEKKARQNRNKIIEPKHKQDYFNEPYSSHTHLHKVKGEHQELLNAIDRTLIQFGLSDTTTNVDANMNNCSSKALKRELDYRDETPSILESYAVTKSTNTATFPLRKSKSAPNPFKNVRLTVNLADDAANNEATKKEELAGISNWNNPHPRAYGLAVTLYEKNPVTKQHAGSPIADCFAVVARENSAILALADGVNWGEKACVAARSAIHGCVEYLNKTLFTSYSGSKVTNTTEVFVALLRSFNVAHSYILQAGGLLTTLTVVVVLPLASSDTEKYIACVCNVGDSLAYVFNVSHGVREITKGSHDINCMRDMRDALGALGPVEGTNPELSNLTCSMTEVNKGDIVFITSDGVSDNFDPVVGKFAIMNTNKPEVATHNRPLVQAIQRHELTLLRLEDILRSDVSGNGPICCSAKELCTRLLDFVMRLTSAKRKILEDVELYFNEEGGILKELSKAEQKLRRKNAGERVAMVPGKLDHASVVAYNVGRYDTQQDQTSSGSRKPQESSL